MKEKTYFISAVASKYNIHPQTLRLYEREGLLIPSRSKGNTRMFSEEDLKKLEFILNLTREMGVNLAGIEIIMNMKGKMEKMQDEFALFLEELKKEFFVPWHYLRICFCFWFVRQQARQKSSRKKAIFIRAMA